jgi:hypothetical protein
MAAPEYVPVKPMDDVRVYESPPRRPEPWLANRPGDTAGAPAVMGNWFGWQGPDQGYALTLARRFEGRLSLADGEHEDDAIAGCTGVALKRASLFGRAPVVYDLRVAFMVWGFLDDQPPVDLVDLRRRLFAGVSNPHHYAEAQRIVDAVPESTLHMTPDAVERDHRAEWRSLLDVEATLATTI